MTSEDDEAAWFAHVEDELIPMITNSAITISLVPTGKADIKFAVELGLCIMLDKPIIAVVTPGRRIPDHLRRVADEIVEIADIHSPIAQQQLTAAIKRITGREDIDLRGNA